MKKSSGCVNLFLLPLLLLLLLLSSLLAIVSVYVSRECAVKLESSSSRRREIDLELGAVWPLFACSSTICTTSSQQPTAAAAARAPSFAVSGAVCTSCLVSALPSPAKHWRALPHFSHFLFSLLSTLSESECVYVSAMATSRYSSMAGSSSPLVAVDESTTQKTLKKRQQQHT